ncbi:MAG: transcription-repair coupling factor [Candidatus Dormibacteria bacterium]
MSTLADRLRLDPAHQAFERLLRPGAEVALEAPPAGAQPILAAWLARSGRVVVLVTRDPAVAAEDARRVLGGEVTCHTFPEWGGSVSDRHSPPAPVRAARLAATSRLARGGPLLVSASPAALLQPTLGPQALAAATLELVPGLRAEPEELGARLVAMGYQREPLAEDPGTFAVRGGLLDVFPLGAAFPVRAEWFGSEIESMRTFHPENQRTILPSRHELVLPAREISGDPGSLRRLAASVRALDLEGCRADVLGAFQDDIAHLEAGTPFDGMEVYSRLCPSTSTFAAHLPPGAVVLDLVTPGSGENWWRRQLEVAQGETERAELPGDLVLPAFAPSEAMAGARDVTLVRAAAEGGLSLGYRAAEAYAGQPDRLVASLGVGVDWLRTGQEKRLLSLVENRGVRPGELEVTLDEPDLPDTAAVLDGREATGGFSHPGLGLRLLSDVELFGRAAGRTRTVIAPRRRISDAVDLRPGDYLVHTDHGIGRFLGMSVQEVDGAEREYLAIEYSGGDRVYVPVEYLDRVQKYLGGKDGAPALSRLGGTEWASTRRRAKADAEAVARDLLELYSRRARSEGLAYGPDTPWQGQLEESFPYQETPDQLQAVAEIKADMEQGEPMDRLLCGDVGFGKTEVAVRAAFKAVMDGRQVAVLVPTTVLAQQHYFTFTERLSAFPVKVGSLSRFSSAKEVSDVLARLRTGEVDIVVGTHRLLAADVKFRNLGLIVIDEEQRFGVMQKEKLKRLRAEVDVLSMSATPIPRSLHMSLAGVRDMSVIQTPPEDRLPIRTYVTARDNELLKQVITRELSRGGQVYYLHNQVKTIERCAEDLRTLIPNSRVAVAHGQMDERQLARTMLDFTAQRYDVLVCSTIIESGLDNPHANTILVDNAHRLGLAQLYQLRGRVGRGGVKAYAYFLYDPDRSLTEHADKRLDVVSELQDLGSGFKLALKDLEIRGAGNLLGTEQHGAIAAVGFELYTRMLNEAVSTLRGGEVHQDLPEVTLALPVDHFLPHDYVEDERLRLQTYRELAEHQTEAALDAAESELKDRFGELPDPVRNLVWSLRLKVLAAGAHVAGVALDGRTLTLRFGPSGPPESATLAGLPPSAVRLLGGKLRADTSAWGADWQDRLLEALRQLEGARVANLSA